MEALIIIVLVLYAEDGRGELVYKAFYSSNLIKVIFLLLSVYNYYDNISAY